MPNLIKSLISARLHNRLGTSIDVSAPQLELGNVLVPVTQADGLLLRSKGQAVTGSATSRTDTYTVPSGKKWNIKNILLIRANAAIMAIQFLLQGTGYFVQYSLATDTYMKYIGTDIILLPGDAVVCTFNTGTSGALDSVIVYEEEDYY